MLKTPTTIRFAHHHSLHNSEKHNQSSSNLLILPERGLTTGSSSGDSIQQPSEPPFYLQMVKDRGDWYASGILHDFNNQLAIILSHCSIALTKLPADSNARTNLDRAIRATKRAADLSSQLQVGMAIQDVEMETLDFNGLIQEAMETFEPLLPTGITLEADYKAELPHIVVNRLLIHRTLLNVLLNAVESIPGEAGQVTIATDLVTFSDPAQEGYKQGLPPGRHVMLEVSDTGCGMSQEELEQVFIPHFSTKSLRMGLGLPLVYHTMQVHNGPIQVQSTPNHGTVFQLYFPTSPEH